MKKIFWTVIISILFPLIVIANGSESSISGAIYDVWTKKIVSDYTIKFTLKSFFFQKEPNPFPWLRPNEYTVIVTDDGNYNFSLREDSYYLDVNSLIPGYEPNNTETIIYKNGENFVFPSTLYNLKNGEAIDDGFLKSIEEMSYKNIYLGKNDESANTNPIRKYEEPIRVDIPLDPTIYGGAKPGTIVKLMMNDKIINETVATPEKYKGVFTTNFSGRFSFFALPGEYKIIGENVTVSTLGDEWKAEVLEEEANVE